MIKLKKKTIFKKLINKKNTINNYNKKLNSSNIPKHITIIINNNKQ